MRELGLRRLIQGENTSWTLPHETIGPGAQLQSESHSLRATIEGQQRETNSELAGLPADHSGTYNFLHVDTTITVILYPDSASFQYTPILGTMQQTEYRVAGNRIKEKCNGVFRNCVWIRRD